MPELPHIRFVTKIVGWVVADQALAAEWSAHAQTHMANGHIEAATRCQRAAAYFAEQATTRLARLLDY